MQNVAAFFYKKVSHHREQGGCSTLLYATDFRATCTWYMPESHMHGDCALCITDCTLTGSLSCCLCNWLRIVIREHSQPSAATQSQPLRPHLGFIRLFPDELGLTSQWLVNPSSTCSWTEPLWACGNAWSSDTKAIWPTKVCTTIT